MNTYLLPEWEVLTAPKHEPISCFFDTARLTRTPRPAPKIADSGTISSSTPPAYAAERLREGSRAGALLRSARARGCSDLTQEAKPTTRSPARCPSSPAGGARQLPSPASASSRACLSARPGRRPRRVKGSVKCELRLTHAVCAVASEIVGKQRWLNFDDERFNIISKLKANQTHEIVACRSSSKKHLLRAVGSNSRGTLVCLNDAIDCGAGHLVATPPAEAAVGSVRSGSGSAGRRGPGARSRRSSRRSTRGAPRVNCPPGHDDGVLSVAWKRAISTSKHDYKKLKRG